MWWLLVLFLLFLLNIFIVGFLAVTCLNALRVPQIPLNSLTIVSAAILLTLINREVIPLQDMVLIARMLLPKWLGGE